MTCGARASAEEWPGHREGYADRAPASPSRTSDGVRASARRYAACMSFDDPKTGQADNGGEDAPLREEDVLREGAMLDDRVEEGDDQDGE